MYRVQVNLLAVDELVAAQVQADLHAYLAEYGPEKVSDVVVVRHRHVEGSSNDTGPSFNRQAARTSGQTVDVTQPGGVG